MSTGHESITKEKREELKQLHKNATPIPWSVVDNYGFVDIWTGENGRFGSILFSDYAREIKKRLGAFRSKDDAEFIAAARVALPHLIDDLEWLEDTLERRLEAERQKCCDEIRERCLSCDGTGIDTTLEPNGPCQWCGIPIDRIKEMKK